MIGAGKTRDLVLSATLLSAERARLLGIVEHITAPAELTGVALGIASRWAGFEPNAVRAVLMCAHEAENHTDTNNLETILFQNCYATERNRELLRNFQKQSSQQRSKPSTREAVQ